MTPQPTSAQGPRLGQPALRETGENGGPDLAPGQWAMTGPPSKAPAILGPQPGAAGPSCAAGRDLGGQRSTAPTLILNAYASTMPWNGLVTVPIPGNLTVGQIVDPLARAGFVETRLVEESFLLEIEEWFDRGTLAESEGRRSNRPLLCVTDPGYSSHCLRRLIEPD